MRLSDPGRCAVESAGSIARPIHERMVRLARTEPDAEVRSELASTAGRLAGSARRSTVLQELIAPAGGRLRTSTFRCDIWWTLEDAITRDADVVLSWLEESGVWQAPLFTEHLAGRIARRLAADRGDTPAFRRIDPDNNWKEYARTPARPDARRQG